LVGENHEDQFPQILHKLEQYNIVAGINDSTGLGDPIHARLSAIYRRKNVTVHPFIYTAKSKHDGFALLKQEIVAGRLTFPGANLLPQVSTKFKRFHKQFVDLVRDFNEKTKYNTYKAPDIKDAHDDYPCSVMMLCHLVNVLTLPRIEATDTAHYQKTRRDIEAKRRFLNRQGASLDPNAPSVQKPRMFSRPKRDLYDVWAEEQEILKNAKVQ
jgi:hypothetical protein